MPVDRLNKIRFGTELEMLQSSVWFGRLLKKNYSLGHYLPGATIGDPNPMLKAVQVGAQLHEALQSAGLRRSSMPSGRKRSPPSAKSSPG
jgi:hypothetical protein